MPFGLEAGNRRRGAGWWPKRKFWRRGPKCPMGLMAKGMRSILHCNRSPSRESPLVVTEVDVSILVKRLNFLLIFL